MSDIDEVWKIVQELAEGDPYAYNDNNGCMECLYCNDFYAFGPNAKHTKDHEATCLMRRAQKLVEQQKENP